MAGTETAGTGDADEKSTRKQSESTEETGRTGEKESSEAKGNIEAPEEETTETESTETGSEEESSEASGGEAGSEEETTEASGSDAKSEEETTEASGVDAAGKKTEDSKTDAKESETAESKSTEETAGAKSGEDDSETEESTASSDKSGTASDKGTAESKEAEETTAAADSSTEETTAAAEESTEETTAAEESGNGKGQGILGTIANGISSLVNTIQGVLANVMPTTLSNEVKTPTELNASYYEVSTEVEFRAAVELLNENADGGTVSIIKNIKFVDEEDVPIEKNITILGNGHTVTARSQLLVRPGATLNLGSADGKDTFTFNGITEKISKNHGPIVYVDGGTLNMYKGVSLEARKNPHEYPQLAAGVHVLNSGSFYMYGGTIKNCVGYYGGVYLDEGCQFGMASGSIISGCGNEIEYGGGITSIGGDVYINGGIIGGNASSMSGGGIFCNGGTLTVKNAGIMKNMATYRGNGIYCVNATVDIDGSIINENVNASEAGAACFIGGNVSIKNTEVSSNIAAENGGGFYFEGSDGNDSFEIDNVTFNKNRAQNGNGGGICIDNATVIIKNSTISNNSINDQRATGLGGGIYLNNGGLGIKDSVISGNLSRHAGGGIYSNNSSLVLEGTRVIKNEFIYAGKVGAGGGIYAKDSSVEIGAGSVIGENKAYEQGGGIYIEHGALNAAAGTIIGNNTVTNRYQQIDEGADIYAVSGCDLSGFNLDASTMNLKYRDSSSYIDGWYNDPADDRYDPSFGGVPVPASDIQEQSSVSLVASYRTELKIWVIYEFLGDVPEEAAKPANTEIDPKTAFTAKYPEAVPGYSFDGWYTDEKCTEKFEDGTVVEDTMRLYGKWDKEADKVWVSYDFVGDVPEEAARPASENVEKGDKFTPEYPEAVSGYSFDGWYTDKECTDKFEDGTAVNADTTLYGRWSKDSERVWVTYKYVGTVPSSASIPADVDVVIGEKFTAQEPAEVYGYKFDGWYTDEACTKSFKDGTVIEAATTLYGKWEKTSTGGGSTRNRGSEAAGYGTAASGSGVISGSWQKDSTGRYEYFVKTDGTQIRNSWAFLAAPDTTAAQNVNNWYRFDANGELVRGWYKETTGTSTVKWYYLDKDGGNMLTGWHYDNEDGKWYYLSPADGHMLTGWQLVGGKWYYFNSSAPGQTWDYNGSEWHFNDSAARPYGSMYADETTPDNHIVDANGAWKQQPQKPKKRTLTHEDLIIGVLDAWNQ